MEEQAQQSLLMNYRLAYLGDSWVNWCPELWTVLANDEVSNGLSVRGGHPVERKLMKQWSLRISYAQRLLDGLETIDWSESIKEIQRNWIGRVRVEGSFAIKGHEERLDIFTTCRYYLGVTFMVIAPEHPFIDLLTTSEYEKGG